MPSQLWGKEIILFLCQANHVQSMKERSPWDQQNQKPKVYCLLMYAVFCAMSVLR